MGVTAGTRLLSQLPQGAIRQFCRSRYTALMAEQCVFTRRVRRLDRLTGGLGPSNFPPKN
jgi:hypothetical protein